MSEIKPVAWAWLKDGLPVNVFLDRGDADDPYWQDKGYSTVPLYTADALTAARDAALEEALASLPVSVVIDGKPDGYGKGYLDCARDCAAAIRALKGKP